MIINPLQGKQLESVRLATETYNLWEGSVRSSKTICSLMWWLDYVLHGPAGNLLMVGKTERTLKRNIIDPLAEMVGEKMCKHNRGEGELLLLGRRIYLGGAHDAKSEDKIRGLTLAGAYGDEISTWPEGFWAMLLTRLSVEGARLGGTTNPDNPNHWLMRDHLSRARTWLRHDGTVTTNEDRSTLDMARFSFRLEDNTALPAKYVEAMKKQFVGLWYKRYIEGLWVLAEGAIFDMFESEPFDPETNTGHLVSTLPRMAEWIISIDYGTTNPFVALLIGVGVDDRLYVAREWRWDSRKQRRQLTDAEYSAEMRKWLTQCELELGRIDLGGVYVDPSAASFHAQLWHDQWPGVHGADNAVEDGIRWTSTLLGAHRLLIHESCRDTGLVDEVTGYVWDDKAAERGVEQPMKVADHGPDAKRYGVMATRKFWRYWLDEDLDEAA